MARLASFLALGTALAIRTGSSVQDVPYAALRARLAADGAALEASPPGVANPQ